MPTAVSLLKTSALSAVRRETQTQLLSHVTVSPRQGATNVALNAPVSVTAGYGTLTTVLVRTPSGQAVTGTWNAPHTQWVSDQALSPLMLPPSTVIVEVADESAKPPSSDSEPR